MNTRISSLAAVVIFLLSGCSVGTRTADQYPKTETYKINETQMPVFAEDTGIETEPFITSLPSTSQIHSTQTPSENSGAITLPIRNATKKCISIEPSLSSGLLSEGVLFLVDHTEKPGVGKLFTLDRDTGEYQTLPELPSYISGYVSPNLVRLMYDHSDSDNSYTMSFISSEGRIFNSFPIEDSWSSDNWLNDQQIIIDMINGTPTLADIIDVISGDRETIAPDLPLFFDGFPGESWGYWKFLYDPTMTRVAYKQENAEGNPDFVLWNLESEEEMYRLNKYSVHYSKPAWSPDGSRIAVVAMNQREDDYDRFELYIIDTDGQGSQWIDMKGAFPDALTVRIKWSPDSRYIAIMNIKELSSLLILDTSTGELLDYCVEGGHPNDPILWSPDSTQVILPVWEAPSILIDIENEIAAQLVQDEHFVPVAWLINSE